MIRYPLLLFFQMIFSLQSQSQQADYDSIILVRNCLILDAKESVQEERDDLIYKWNFGDGSIGAGEVVEHCYNQIGTYEVNLTIVDPELLIMTPDEWLFEVVIAADYSLSMGVQSRTEKSVNLSSNMIYLEIPDRIDFFWDYGDGNYGIGEKMKHTYDQEGNYTVRLLAQVEINGEVINFSTEQKIQIN